MGCELSNGCEKDWGRDRVCTWFGEDPHLTNCSGSNQGTQVSYSWILLMESSPTNCSGSNQGTQVSCSWILLMESGPINCSNSDPVCSEEACHTSGVGSTHWTGCLIAEIAEVLWGSQYLLANCLTDSCQKNQTIPTMEQKWMWMGLAQWCCWPWPPPLRYLEVLTVLLESTH